MCVGLGLMTVGALAQTADVSAQVYTTIATTDTSPEPADTTVLPDWKPGDGRPPWSKAPEGVTKFGSSWQPSDGQPPWANANGQPDWADRPTQDATPDVSSHEAFAAGEGSRGKGRNK